MWQRFQTLLLAVATLMIASLFWCDLAGIPVGEGKMDNIAFTSKTIYTVWLSLLTVIQVLALGGFKWRMKQLRVTIVAALLCLAFEGWLAYDYFGNRGAMEYYFTVFFPLAAAVLDVFAIRNILLDEAIVQSASRLRGPRTRKH